MPASRSSDGVARTRGLRAAALLLGCAVGLAGAAGPAQADKVGVAAAVNPDAFTSLSGTPTQQLNIGKSIFYNERINTTSSGLVQVLLVDGSTFTVGPDSDLVIDKFVYDPNKKTGQVVASFSKGTMRFIGGKLSKNEGGVTVKTPAGALAIRGGMVQGNGKIWSFLYGVEMKFTGNNGKTYSVYQPGYTIDFSKGVPQIRPTTAADTASLMNALTHVANRNSTPGTGDSGNNGGTQQTLTETVSMQELISEAAATRVDDELEAEEDTTEPPNITVGDNNPPTNTDTDPPGIDPPGTDPPDTDPPDQPPPTYSTQEGGYASAIAQWTRQGNFANVVASTSPDDVSFASTDATSGTATLILRDVDDIDPATSRYELVFPYGTGLNTNGQNGLSNNVNSHDSPSPTNFDITARVFEDGGQQYSHSIGSGIIGPGSLLFGPSGEGNPDDLCNDCDFMKWGAMIAGVQFGNSDRPDRYQDAITGFWVAGNLPAIGQLPTTGTATYSGLAVGMVSVMDDGSWANPYAARGNLNMDWNFADRSGNLSINNFDANGPMGPLNVSGKMDMPGQLSEINKFSGPLAGTLGGEIAASGAAIGSFAKNGADPAAGVIGNWRAGTPDYKATGIFGGGRIGPN